MTIAEQLTEIGRRTSDELLHFPDLKRVDEPGYPILDCATLLAIIIADRAVLREIQNADSEMILPDVRRMARKRLAE